MFLSLNYTWVSFFVPELPGTKFMCKNELFQSSETKNELFKVQGWKTKLEIHVQKWTFSKLRDEKRTFQSLGTKTELHSKYKNKKNTFAKIYIFTNLWAIMLITNLLTRHAFSNLMSFSFNLKSKISRLTCMQYF